MKGHLKVGTFAKLTSLTIRTLRFYDQIGLFSPSGQTASGHRLYQESDLARLHQILSLKDLGLPLEEIKAVLDEGRYTPLEIIALQMSRIQEQMKLQQKLLGQLKHVSALMEGKQAVTLQDFTELLQAMKTGPEKLVVERRASWERNLDLLGDLLGED